jgi:murein DD-endopeptidase MepM/ murein hydrolase activator NlpD
MIDRRGLLRGALGLAAMSSAARAASQRLSLEGTMEQGSLVVGRTESGTHISADGVDVSVSDVGLFAFGFAFDQIKPVRLDARYSDRTSESRVVTPIVRQYDIQRINGLPEAFVSPPPEIEARISREHQAVSEARKRDSALTAFAQPFDWPAAGIVSGVFGSQRILNGEPKAPHFGVDIAAPVGTPIHAPAAGIVSITDEFYLEGGFTMLDHGHGVSTAYFHQSSRNVSAGDHVVRGQLIGLVGMTGRATGPHVHWGMNWFQVRLDPSRSTATPAPPRA